MHYEQLALLCETDRWKLWRGEHPASHKRYTIKEAKEGPYVEQVRQSLMEEHDFVSKLNHPHILRPCMPDAEHGRILYDDAQGTLAQSLQQAGRLEVDLVANVLVQCLKAVQYLHEGKCGHGTLNSHTILVGPSGEIKLAGFLGYRMDRHGAVPVPDLTARYLAPELLDSDLGRLSASSDLYCLGYLGLELLTGADFDLLFGIDEKGRADPRTNWLGWHADRGRHLLDLRRQIPHVMGAMLDILEAMIRKEIGQRGYRSAAEVIRQLNEFGLTSARAVPALRLVPAPAAPEPPPPRGTLRPQRERPILTLKSSRPGVPVLRFAPDKPILVGRQPDCALELPDRGVSNKHALLSCQPDGWWVFDLSSQAGTRLNGRKILRAPLREGNELQFAGERWQVSFLAPGEKKPPRRGQFELRELLHQGSNGDLWRAVWPQKNFRVVALRIYPSEFELDSEQVRRFLRGMREGGSLVHPNVLRLYWAGTWGEASGKAWFLAMEHMAGGSLRDRLRKGPLPVKEVVQYALDIATALEEASQYDLLHRNINPSCILFTEDGVAKLGDFSLMRSEMLDSIQQITQSRVPLGEQVYQAPEVIRGDKEVGSGCDLYSLAATMYEALTGRAPFPVGLNLPETLHAIATLSVPPLQTRKPSVPAALAELIHACLLKDPKTRPSNASTFRSQLEPLLQE
jgi:serine/threonine protein kinase